MKDHELRELVNNLRDVASEFHASQQLRERISRCLAPVDALREENAKLREQLNKSQRVCCQEFDKCLDACVPKANHWKERAEAAEAKLKAASEQEPIAELIVRPLQGDESTPSKAINWLVPYPQSGKLYTEPVPPVDVQEK